MSAKSKILLTGSLAALLLSLPAMMLDEAHAVPKKTTGQCDLDYLNGLDRCDREKETCKKNEEAGCDSRHSICVNFRKADHRDCLEDADSSSRPLTKSPKTLPKGNLQPAE